MDIQLMQAGHPLWERTMVFARSCSWKAGPFLAGRMENNVFRDWERVAVAVEGGSIAGYCTFTETDELPEGSGYSPFIGFVFVNERYRGRRISEKMIRQVLAYAGTVGFRTVYILSGEHGLYEKYGFRKIGDCRTTYGTTDQLFAIDLPTEQEDNHHDKR